MVQGGLLMAHPGSVHGGGETPGGQSSLRQGAGIGSHGSPDLETATSAEQRRDHGKGFCREKVTVDVRRVLLIMRPLLRGGSKERAYIDTRLGDLPRFRPLFFSR